MRDITCPTCGKETQRHDDDPHDAGLRCWNCGTDIDAAFANDTHENNARIWLDVVFAATHATIQSGTTDPIEWADEVVEEYNKRFGTEATQ